MIVPHDLDKKMKSLIREILKDCADVDNDISLHCLVYKRRDKMLIYEGCGENECNLIIKLQPFNELFLQEVSVHSIFSAEDLTPYIFCQGEKRGIGYIIMENIVMIEKFLQKKRDPEVLDEIINSILEIMSEMCTHFIAHGDLHWGNVGYNLEQQKFQLIDLGWGSVGECKPRFAMVQMLRTLNPQYDMGMHIDNVLYLLENLLTIYFLIFPDHPRFKLYHILHRQGYLSKRDLTEYNFKDIEREYERLIEMYKKIFEKQLVHRKKVYNYLYPAY